MGVVELAAVSGVSAVYIYMLEAATRRNPSVDVLWRLAAALGVPPVSLVPDRKP
jgi:transcriptional regulator with XRE-family HTH domain